MTVGPAVICTCDGHGCKNYTFTSQEMREDDLWPEGWIREVIDYIPESTTMFWTKEYNFCSQACRDDFRERYPRLWRRRITAQGGLTRCHTR